MTALLFTEEVIEANTVATKLQVAFRDAAKANPAATAEELAGVCAQHEAVSLIGPMVAPIAEGWLNGFDAESITGFSEGAVFAPMIGTIAFMGYIFTLPEGAEFEYVVGDWVYIPGINAAIAAGQEEFAAKVITKAGEVIDLPLQCKGLTDDEKLILKEGCLMNYYSAGYGR